jgi:hypothetical protein
VSWIKRLWKTGELVEAPDMNNVETGIQELNNRTGNVVSVLAFGAKGDGVTDNTIPFEEAITAVEAKGGGTVLVPASLAGYGLKPITIKFATGKTPVSIEGEGRECSGLLNLATGSAPLITYKATAGEYINEFRVRQLTIQGKNKEGPGLLLERCAFARVEDVELVNCSVGIEGAGLTTCFFHAVQCFTLNTVGIKLTKDAETKLGCNNVTLDKCVMSNCKKAGLEADYCPLLLVNNCDLELNGETGVTTTGAIRILSHVLKPEPPGFGVGMVMIRDCWLEENKGRAITVESGEVAMYDCLVFQTDTGTAGTRGRDFFVPSAAEVERVSIFNCEFPTTVGATKQIVIEAAACKGEINNCKLNQLYEIPVFMIIKQDSYYTSPLRFATSNLSAATAFEVVTQGLALTGGSLDIKTLGKGLAVKEGSNAKQGVTAAMTAGKLTVANTSVTAESRIILTRQETGTNPGAVFLTERKAGVSFKIESTNAADTGTVAYQIFEPGEG